MAASIPNIPTAIPSAPDPQMVALNRGDFCGAWSKPPVRTATSKPPVSYQGATPVGAMRVASSDMATYCPQVKKGHRPGTP